MVNSLVAFNNSEFFNDLKKRPKNLPLFKGPLVYDTPLFSSFSHETIINQAKQQALLDWNRNLRSYNIADKFNPEHKSIFELRDGKKFESIKELFDFIKKYLLLGINEDEHQQILEQSILHLHQGGIMHAAGIAISKRLLKGLNYPAPTFSFKVNLYPLETGIGIEELLTLKEISTPESQILTAATHTPKLMFDIEHYSSLERAIGYGNVAAHSLTTKINCSLEVQEIFKITEADILNETSHKNALTPILNFANWPLNLLLQQLGLRSEISLKNIKREEIWLQTLSKLSDNISLKIKQQEAHLSENKVETCKVNQSLNDLLTSLNKSNSKIIVKQQKLASTQLMSLKNSKNQSTALSHNVQNKNSYIKYLTSNIEELSKNKFAVSKKITMLNNHRQNMYVENSSLNFIVSSMKDYELQLESIKNNAIQLIEILKSENKFKNDYIKPFSSIINENIMRFEQLKLKHEKFNENISQLKDKLHQTVSSLSETNKKSSSIKNNIESKKQNYNYLNSMLNKLKINFKSLRSNDDYLKYLHQKDLVINIYKSFEKLYLNEQLDINIDDIQSMVKKSHQLQNDIASLLNTKTKLEEILIDFNHELKDEDDNFKQLINSYQKPNILFKNIKLDPNITSQYQDLEIKIFNQIKIKIFEIIKSYSEPTSGWFFAGQWGKQNALRANNFLENISSSTDLKSLLDLLKQEYIKTEKQVNNTNGDYRETLFKTIKYASNYFIENNLNQEEASNYLETNTAPCN